MGKEGEKRKCRKKISLLWLPVIRSTTEIWPDGFRGKNNVIRAVALHLCSPLVLSPQDDRALVGTSPVLPPQAQGGGRRMAGQSMAGQVEVQEVTGGNGSGAPLLLGSQGAYSGTSTSHFQGTGSDCQACASIQLPLKTQTPASISALNIFELPYHSGEKKIWRFFFNFEEEWHKDITIVSCLKLSHS